MKRFSYGERDYAFGQTMLTLRTSIGLTQAGLADLLGVSRQAAHQKVLLDEHWLQELLGTQRPPHTSVPPGPVEESSKVEQALAPPALGPRADWGDALAVPTFSLPEGANSSSLP